MTDERHNVAARHLFHPISPVMLESSPEQGATLSSHRSNGGKNTKSRPSTIQALFKLFLCLYIITLVILVTALVAFNNHGDAVPRPLAVSVACIVLLSSFFCGIIACWRHYRMKMPAIIYGNGRHGWQVDANGEATGENAASARTTARIWSAQGGWNGFLKNADGPTKVAIISMILSVWTTRARCAAASALQVGDEESSSAGLDRQKQRGTQVVAPVHSAHPTTPLDVPYMLHPPGLAGPLRVTNPSESMKTDSPTNDPTFDDSPPRDFPVRSYKQRAHPQPEAAPPKETSASATAQTPNPAPPDIATPKLSSDDFPASDLKVSPSPKVASVGENTAPTPVAAPAPPPLLKTESPDHDADRAPSFNSDRLSRYKASGLPSCLSIGPSRASSSVSPSPMGTEPKSPEASKPHRG